MYRVRKVVTRSSQAPLSTCASDRPCSQRRRPCKFVSAQRYAQEARRRSEERGHTGCPYPEGRLSQLDRRGLPDIRQISTQLRMPTIDARDLSTKSYDRHVVKGLLNGRHPNARRKTIASSAKNHIKIASDYTTEKALEKPNFAKATATKIQMRPNQSGASLQPWA